MSEPEIVKPDKLTGFDNQLNLHQVGQILWTIGYKNIIKKRTFYINFLIEQNNKIKFHTLELNYFNFAVKGQYILFLHSSKFYFLEQN